MATVSAQTRLDPVLDTDGLFVVRDIDGTPADGSCTLAVLKAYTSGGLLYPAFTTPVDGDYAWINQGGASTIVNANGGICLLAPTDAGNNIRIRKKAAPATPYTITAGFLTTFQLESGTPFVGVGWRESGSGKLVIISVRAQNGNNLPKLQMMTYASPTSSETNVFTRYWMFPSPMWFRLEDDGTDRKIYVSADGFNFMLVHSEVRTTYITADETLFCVNSLNGDVPVGMTLLSWEEA